MRDLGTVSTDYTTKIPCNDTLYQLWEKSPGSSDNPCLDYDFPQDPATELNSTSSATPSSTPSPSSSGNADSTSDDDPSGDANASSDNNSQDSESDADEEDASNGADRVLSVPVGGGLIMAGLILGSLL